MASSPFLGLLLADCAHCQQMNTEERWALEMFAELARTIEGDVVETGN